jgi:hypothetical protein
MVIADAAMANLRAATASRPAVRTGRSLRWPNFATFDRICSWPQIFVG